MIINLIQPRHIYAPDFQSNVAGHVYMPTSLIAVASFMISCGFQVKIIDYNFGDEYIESNIVGANLLGAPYIPEVIKLRDRLLNQFGKGNFKLLLGGQVINGLKAEEFLQLFGNCSVNGNNTEQLLRSLDFSSYVYPNLENLSFIDGYKAIPDDKMIHYLSTEFGFYLSQGCKHSCTFCGAQRSRKDSYTGNFQFRQESYRDISIALGDLEFLIRKSIDFGIRNISFYLSNLDLFQTPKKLFEFANGLIEIEKKYPALGVEYRALSNVDSFVKVHDSMPELIKRCKESGLKRIGFGIDGASPKIWKNTRKPHTKSLCLKAIKYCKESYDIIPETLMVFGYNEFETEETLKLALDFTITMNYKYGALPRPHIAKELIPLSDFWTENAYKNKVNYLLQNPVLFQNLDFTALPSRFTHEKDSHREIVSDYYIKMCSLEDSLTQYVKPIELGMKSAELQRVNEFNLERYDF